MNVASGVCSRAACSRLSVPFALTVKSVCGSRRRPVVRGLRRGVDDQLDVLGVLGEQPLDALAVADVEVQRAERVELARELLAHVPRRRLRPKKLARMSLSSPMTSRPSALKWRTVSEPMRPPGAGDDGDAHDARRVEASLRAHAPRLSRSGPVSAPATARRACRSASSSRSSPSPASCGGRSSSRRPTFPGDTGGWALIGAAVVVYAAETLARGWRWHVILRHAAIEHQRRRRGRRHGRRLHGQHRAARARRRGPADPRHGRPDRGAAARGPRDDRARARCSTSAALALLFAVITLLGAQKTSIGPSVGDRGRRRRRSLGAVALYVYHRLRGAGHFEAFAARIRPVARGSRLLVTPWGAGLLLLTCAVWIGEGVTLTLIAQALDVSLSWAEAFATVVLASFFSLIPAAPGFVGTFDAAVIFGLKAANVTGSAARQRPAHVPLRRLRPDHDPRADPAAHPLRRDRDAALSRAHRGRGPRCRGSSRGCRRGSRAPRGGDARPCVRTARCSR